MGGLEVDRGPDVGIESEEVEDTGVSDSAVGDHEDRLAPVVGGQPVEGGGHSGGKVRPRFPVGSEGHGRVPPFDGAVKREVLVPRHSFGVAGTHFFEVRIKCIHGSAECVGDDGRSFSSTSNGGRHDHVRGEALGLQAPGDNFGLKYPEW